MAGVMENVYAGALFETAVEKDKLEELLEDTDFLLRVWQENTELSGLAGGPELSVSDRLRIINHVFEGRVSQEMMGLLAVVTEKGHIPELVKILEAFQDQVRVYKNMGIASVTSAVELSEKQQLQIESLLLKITGYTSCSVKYRVDPMLIGGLVLRVGDRLVDASMRTQFDELRKRCSAI